MDLWFFYLNTSFNRYCIFHTFSWFKFLLNLQLHVCYSLTRSTVIFPMQGYLHSAAVIYLTQRRKMSVCLLIWRTNGAAWTRSRHHNFHYFFHSLVAFHKLYAGDTIDFDSSFSIDTLTQRYTKMLAVNRWSGLSFFFNFIHGTLSFCNLHNVAWWYWFLFLPVCVMWTIDNSQWYCYYISLTYIVYNNLQNVNSLW